MPNSKEIDWKKEITEARSSVGPWEKRSLQLKTAALELWQNFRIEEIFEGIKEQVLGQGEIINGGFHETRLCVDIPVGCTLRKYLRSGIRINVPGYSTPNYKGWIGEERFAGYRDVPGFECEGYHVLVVEVEAGLRTKVESELNWGEVEHAYKTRGDDQFYRTELINAYSEIFPVDKDKRSDVEVAGTGNIFRLYVNSQSAIEETRQNLTKALARYLGSTDLTQTTILPNRGGRGFVVTYPF